MKIARYWYRAKATRTNTQYRDQLWTRWAWGWSDESPESARAMATTRAEAVVARIAAADLSGEDVNDWYDYPERVLPELVVDTIANEDGSIAGSLTVNRYGATILNTARLAIVDVDLPERLLRPPSLLKRVAGRLFGGQDRGLDGAMANDRLRAHIEERTSFLRLWAMAATHEPRGARVYRTAGGLRVILVEPAMDPIAPETDHLMKLMDADPLYRRLCKAQHCYRARLTPKPWRLGLVAPNFTYATLTSDDPATKARVERWSAEYARLGRGHAVCRLLETVGTEASDPVTARLIELHDSATLGTNDVPLA